MIDTMPDTKTRSPVDDRASFVEPVSWYVTAPGFNDNGEEDIVRRALGRLADKLHYGPSESESETVEDAYAVARHLVDCEIRDVDKDEGRGEAVFQLLNSTRSMGRYTTSFSHRSDALGHLGTRRSSEGSVADRHELGVNIDDIRSTTYQRAMCEAARSQGIDLQPEHVGLLRLMQTAGHEAGHLVNSSIAQQHLHTKEENVKMQPVSRLVVAMHGEVVTANRETDARIYEERFAEGYGNTALRVAARYLGYPDSTAQWLVEYMAIKPTNPNIAEANRRLHEVTPEKSLRDVSNEHGEDLNPGSLGYLYPLSTGEVVAALYDVNEYILTPSDTRPSVEELEALLPKTRNDRLLHEAFPLTTRRRRILRKLGDRASSLFHPW